MELKIFLRWELWIILLVSTLTTLCIQLFYSSGSGMEQAAAASFTGKTGVDLVVFPAADRVEELPLLSSCSPAPVPRSMIDNDAQLAASISRITGAQALYPLAGMTAYLYVNQEKKLPVCCFTLSTGLLQDYLAHFPLEEGQLPAPGATGLVLSSGLAAALQQEPALPGAPGAELLLIRELDTYLDLIQVPVSGIIKRTGYAVFLQAADFSRLQGLLVAGESPESGPITVPAESTEQPAPAEGSVTVRDGSPRLSLLPDSFFFELPGIPAAIPPQTAYRPPGCHYILIKTGSKAAAGKLNTFFTSSGLPLQAAGSHEWLTAVCPGSWRAQLYVWILVFACLSGLSLTRYLSRIFLPPHGALARTATRQQLRRTAGVLMAVCWLTATGLSFLISGVIRFTDLPWINKGLFASLVINPALCLAVTPAGLTVSLAVQLTVLAGGLIFPLRYYGKQQANGDRL